MSAVAETPRNPIRFHNPTRLDNRVGVALVLIALVSCLAGVVLYLAAALNWHNQAFFGVLYSRTLVIDGSTPISDDGFPGLTAGMRRGDQIVGINGEELPSEPAGAALARAQEIQRTLDATQPVTLEFLRAINADAPLTSGTETCTPLENGLARCTVTFVPGTLSDIEFFAFFLVPFVSGVIVLGIGVIVIVLRPNLGATRHVGVVCLLAGAFMLGLFDINSSHQYAAAWILASCMLGGALAGMAFVFPMKMGIALRYPAIRLLPPSITFVIALVFIEMYYFPPDAQSGNIMLQWSTGIVVLGAVGVLPTRKKGSHSSGHHDPPGNSRGGRAPKHGG